MKIDYEALSGCYESLDYYANEMLTYVNNIKNVVKKMDSSEHWDGNGYKNYNNKLNDLATNFSSYINEIFSLNRVLKNSIENYKNVDSTVKEVKF